MKILIFTTQFYQLSGIERLAVELAVDLNKQGLRADLLSLYSGQMSGVARAREQLLRQGVPSVEFLGLQVHPSLGNVAGALLDLRRLIERGEYDVVETSSFLPTLMASWARRGLRAQHVAGLHDVFSSAYYGGSRQWLWRTALRWAGRTRFYAISDSAREGWLAYSKTAAHRTRVLYNGIPEVWFDTPADRDGLRRELGIPADTKLLVFVGRLLKRKGIDTLLEAVGPQLESWNAHLLYVGEPDQASEWIDPQEGTLLPEMRARAQRNGWSTRVHFLGARQDVPRIMASSDLLVHPARLEAFGLVLAEALATGIPVVASNVQGIPEVLADSGSLQVPPDDPRALRDAVDEALRRTSNEAQDIAARGRARAERFRTRRRTEAMVQMFRDTVAGYGRGR